LRARIGGSLSRAGGFRHADRLCRFAAEPIEIMFGRLKDWRRVATRYERCAKAFCSAIAPAATVILWL
jgi:hypothetical protein